MLSERRNGTRGQAQTRLTLEDGITLWRAREVYRARENLRAFVLFLFLLEWGLLALEGHWLAGLGIVVAQWYALRGLLLVLRLAVQGIEDGLRWLGGWLGRRVQAWWHGRN